MSKISKNKLDRAKIFSQKWTRGFIQGLHPSAIAARFNGPKIFINSVPKAGTHLLEQTLGLYPQLHFMGRPTIKHWKNNEIQRLEKIMRRIKRGAFRSGHLEYALKLEEIIDSNEIMMIEGIRDPRDVIISQWKYVTKIDLTHKESIALSESAESDKLLQMMKGIPDKIRPIDEVWRMHKGWINKQSILVIKFEDLIGPKGGGTRGQQLECINNIADYLKLSCTKREIIRISNGIFSETAATFRKGKIGGWRIYLKEHHKILIKKKLGKVLIQLGYEKNYDW